MEGRLYVSNLNVLLVVNAIWIIQVAFALNISFYFYWIKCHNQLYMEIKCHNNVVIVYLVPIKRGMGFILNYSVLFLHFYCCRFQRNMQKLIDVSFKFIIFVPDFLSWLMIASNDDSHELLITLRISPKLSACVCFLLKYFFFDFSFYC